MVKVRYLNHRGASILLFAALLSTFTFISMTKQCFSSAMSFIVTEGVMTKSQTGTIVSVFYLVYGFLQVVGGVLTDKWKPERFITFGFIGAGLCNLAVYFNQNYSFVMVMWVLNAIAQFAVWPAVFKMISSMMCEEHRTTGLFLIAFSNPFGTVINFAVAAVIPRWQLNLLISAIGLFVFAALFEIAFARVRPHLIEEEIEPPTQPVHTHYHDEQENPHFMRLLFTSGIGLFLVVALVRAIFDNGFKTLVATMMTESYEELSPATATALTIIILIAGTIGSILAKRLYPRYIKNEITATLLLFLAALPFACLMLFIGKIHYVLIVLFISLVVLMANGAALFTSYIAARFNKWGKSATVAGIFNALAALGIVISNFVFTRVAERFDWLTTIEIWIILLIVSILLLFAINPMWKRFLKNQYYE